MVTGRWKEPQKVKDGLKGSVLIWGTVEQGVESEQFRTHLGNCEPSSV
jgi:hypothetical protein